MDEAEEGGVVEDVYRGGTNTATATHTQYGADVEMYDGDAMDRTAHVTGVTEYASNAGDQWESEGEAGIEEESDQTEPVNETVANETEQNSVVIRDVTEGTREMCTANDADALKNVVLKFTKG
ncbi:hypothetical protein SARC_15221, partial [Sphaeroforma arctica JP610]